MLYTDASHSSIGACLTQECEDGEEVVPGIRNEKPIYYLSHKLSDTQTRWSTIEKEAFAFHYALQKLEHYLHNAEFTIKTDHKSLKYIPESSMQNKKIQHWALRLSGYNCKVEYIKGVQNTCADLLSRTSQSSESRAEEVQYEPDITDKTFEINAINSNEFDPKTFVNCSMEKTDTIRLPFSKTTTVDLTEEQKKDEEVRKLLLQLRSGDAQKSIQESHMIVEDVLYYFSSADNDVTLRLVIPEHLEGSVIHQYHDKKIGIWGLTRQMIALDKNTVG